MAVVDVPFCRFVLWVLVEVDDVVSGKFMSIFDVGRAARQHCTGHVTCLARGSALRLILGFFLSSNFKLLQYPSLYRDTQYPHPLQRAISLRTEWNYISRVSTMYIATSDLKINDAR